MIVPFKHWECHVLFHESSNGNTAMQLVDARDGMPVATATVEPNIKMDKNMVCIKKDMYKALREAGVVSEPLDSIGYAQVLVCNLLVPVFEEVAE